MNVDTIFETFNRHGCQFLLIGGMNFTLRHQPILTYDLDLWIEDTLSNRQYCEQALAELDAQWGPSDETWTPVRQLPAGWLESQHIFCVNSPHGAIDIFRSVKGLGDWQASWSRSLTESTSAGTKYRGLSDEDMLECQLALTEGLQKQERIRALRNAIEQRRQS